MYDVAEKLTWRWVKRAAKALSVPFILAHCEQIGEEPSDAVSDGGGTGAGTQTEGGVLGEGGDGGSKENRVMSNGDGKDRTVGYLNGGPSTACILGYSMDTHCAGGSVGGKELDEVVSEVDASAKPSQTTVSDSQILIGDLKCVSGSACWKLAPVEWWRWRTYDQKIEGMAESRMPAFLTSSAALIAVGVLILMRGLSSSEA